MAQNKQGNYFDNGKTLNSGVYFQNIRNNDRIPYIGTYILFPKQWHILHDIPGNGKEEKVSYIGAYPLVAYIMVQNTKIFSIKAGKSL